MTSNALKKYITTFLVLSSIAMVSFNSFASYTQVSALISGYNDCGGGNNNQYFYDGNSGFDNCKIFVEDSNGIKQYLSDTIAKFDTENKSITNSDFDASSAYNVVKSDWVFTDSVASDSTGTWTYNEDVHTYPDIRFWTAKSSNGFRLFWVIENTADTTDDFCIAGNNASTSANLNFDCMNLAISVTNGQWVSPNGSLSHLTFFGGLCNGPDCGNPPNPDTVVPEPSTLAIFALGLIGLGVRRKQAMRIKK
jgi:hypothetical protein